MVFSLRPRLRAYRITGENDYYFKGSKEGFMVGCSDGKSALRLDDDLNRGQSEACATFDNEPLSAPGQSGDLRKRSGYFTVKVLEMWAFMDPTRAKDYAATNGLC